MTSFDSSVYLTRRKTLKELLGSGQVLLIGNQESGMNFKDNWYHFRQDSTMLYYTGIDQPNIHLLIDIDSETEVIYGNDLSIDDIVWTGPLPTLSETAGAAGINQVKPRNEIFKDVHKDVMYLPPYRPEHYLFLRQFLNVTRKEAEAASSHALIKAIISQRNIKERREVDQMDQAASRSYDLHGAVMNKLKPGLYEYHLVGFASEAAFRHNSVFAYPAILTKRGEVLHNHDHTGLLTEGDMVLYDGGCESAMHYAGDITRTFPVSGKWDPLQKDLYDIVYNAYEQSVEALKPGVFFKDIHLLACRALTSGLKDLGFMKGDIDEAVFEGAHTMFFQCGLGHLIGLDVHDMENLGEHLVGYGEGMEKSKEFGLKSLRLGRALEPGFAVTVEPGIYIIPALIELRRSQGLYKDFINYDKLEKHQDFGGIRLEDNFIITTEGSQLLGADNLIARTSSEIENSMK